MARYEAMARLEFTHFLKAYRDFTQCFQGCDDFWKWILRGRRPSRLSVAEVEQLGKSRQEL